MMKKTGFIKLLTGVLLSVCLVSCGNPATAVNYYFDPVSGDDNNPGTSAGKAFRSFLIMEQLVIRPGDSILLKGGATFQEPLKLSCKGSAEKPVVIGQYGPAGRPVIAGQGRSEAAVHVFNSEHVVIRDLEISNDAGNPVAGLHGLWVELRNYGTAKNIRIDNLFVHDVTGSCTRGEKDGGHAILIQNYHEDDPDTILSNFEGLSVQNCHIKDCSRSGIIFWGNWIRSKWKPSTGVVIRNNLLEGVPGDGIVPVGCEGVLVEYNVMKDCPGTLPVTEAADGIWPWSCDNALVQYNIVSDHKSPVDAYGFDSDWNSNNSVFQYNLSYNNDGGFLLVCNSGGWTPDWSIGNKGTIARYNLSINDGLRNYKLKEDFFSPVIHCTGPIKNSLIEKNLFILLKKPKEEIDRTLISLTDWKGYPDSTFFKGNFIFTEEPYRTVDHGRSTSTFIANNRYSGEIAGPDAGFDRYPGKFGKQMWYDGTDENWNRLIAFVRDKTISINGKEMRVSELLDLH